MSDAPKRPATGGRLASGYFLGAFAVAVCALLWLRGLGRMMIPLLLIVAVVYGLRRFIRLLREPVD